MSKKKKNWLEKFQDFWWDGLTPMQRSHLWPVLTALRGPDETNEKTSGIAQDVKLGTTARIRYLLLGKMPKAKYDYWCWPIYGYLAKEESRPTTIKQVNKLSKHFKGHVQRAIGNLKPVVKKSEMKDLLEMFDPEKSDESN
jgi:hypothetical protein